MLRISIHPTTPCYVSKNGNDTFVYFVDGNEADLKAYKKAKGTFYREEEGKPLFFTTDFVGDRGNLIITTKGNVIADKSAFKKASSLANQFDGPLGQAIAQQAAAQLLGHKPADVAPTGAVPQQSVTAESAEEL